MGLRTLAPAAGAIFQDYGTCTVYMGAAGDNNVKMLADPALFWGKNGTWGDAGALVSDQERQTWFNETSSWIVDSQEADVFMGYYSCDEPAWRYYDSRNSPTPRPTPAYIAAASAHVNTLEAGADHALYLAQGDGVKVRDLWPDYNAAADIVGGRVLPFPAPQSLQNDNEVPASPKYNCLLPNYCPSITGSLEDAIYESSRSPTAGGTRNKPYIAVLQAKKRGGVSLTYNNLRFQAFDAIIHGAKGLVWFDDNDGQPITQYNYFYEDVLGKLQSVMMELNAPEVMGALKGDYDQTTIAVTTYPSPGGPTPLEESTFVGGKLVPRTHFLSDRVIMEGIVKKYDGWTYLIVACAAHSGSYTVRFRPYFSANTFWNPWGKDDPSHKVIKLRSGWMPLNVGDGGGWWEDTFNGESVAIYKFQTPTPWQPPIPP